MKNAGGSKQNKRVEGPSFFGKHLPEAIIFCFAFLLYANSIFNNYNLDDELVTRGHKLTSQGISAIPEIFSSPYYTDDAGYSYEYRPVVLSSFAIEHQFLGDNPHVSHFFNLLLYALCCVALYRVLYSIIPGRGQLLSICITLFFVASPTHTEVVCSIKNRDEILSLLFALFSTHFAFRALTGGKKWPFLLIPVCFVLALLSKNTAISFVVIIPLVAIFFTEASFAQIILISLLLLIPGMWSINMDLWHKLIGGLLLIIALLVFYVFVCHDSTFIQEKLSRLKLLSKGQDNYLSRFSPVLSARGFKDFFVGIKPDVAIFSFKPIAITLATGGAYFLGVYFAFSPAVLIAAFVLGFLIWRGEEPIRWWATVILFACLAFAPVKYVWGKTLYSELVSTVLIYNIFFGNRKLLIPTSVIYVIYALLALQFKEFIVLPDRLFGLVMLKIIGWPAILWQTMMVHNFFKHLQFGNLLNAHELLSPIGIASLLVTALMLLLIFKKGTRHLVNGMVVMAIGVLLFYQGHHSPLNVVEAQNKITNTVNKLDPRFIEAKQQRPLDYAEQPVSNQDPLNIRIGTSLEVMAHYFSKTILPYPMAFYYGYRFIKPETITEAMPLIGLLIFGALGFLAIVLIGKNKLLSIGLLIYLSSLAVFSGFFYPVPGLVAERFMFIPTLGWSIVLGALLFMLFRFDNKLAIKQFSSVATVPKVVFVVILILYSGITFSRNFNWKDDLTLFRHDILYVSESAQANNLLAIHLIHRSTNINDAIEQKDLREEAVVHLKKAVEINPGFFNANYDLGRMYLVLNKPDSALVWFLKANKIKPSFIEITFNIADIYLARGQYLAAIPFLEYAIKNRPTDYRGYSSLSYSYFQLHNFYKSIAVNQLGIENIPLNTAAYVNIGNVYLNLNKPDSAALWANKALAIDPSNQTASQILKQIKR